MSFLLSPEMPVIVICPNSIGFQAWSKYKTIRVIETLPKNINRQILIRKSLLSEKLMTFFFLFRYSRVRVSVSRDPSHPPSRAAVQSSQLVAYMAVAEGPSRAICPSPSRRKDQHLETAAHTASLITGAVFRMSEVEVKNSTLTLHEHVL